MIGRFRMGTPSMVFGPGTKENVRRLAGLVEPRPSWRCSGKVVGYEEHLGLNVLPLERVRCWMDRLTTSDFRGVVNLEVFSPEDLTASLEMVRRATAGDG